MKAGAARVELTPLPGVPTGAGGPDGYAPAERALDPLFVRALLLESAAGAVLLMQADLLGLSRRRADELALAAGTAAGVDPRTVLIVCPQTHNSGSTFNRDFPDAVLTEFANAAHRRWYASLDAAFAEAARAARSRTRPARGAVARDVCPGVCANRRAAMRDGRVVSAWYDPDPAQVIGWGPDDPEAVLVGFMDAETGRLIAGLWHFTGHPNCLWMLPVFSRDYPGVVEDRLREENPGAEFLFLNGFCGDVDPYRCMGVGKRLFTHPFIREPGVDLSPNVAAMRRLGGNLADHVSGLHARLPAPEEWNALRMIRRELVCERRSDERGDYAAHFEPVVELAVLRIGPVGVACAPFEPVVALGLDVKRRSPANVTLVAGHTPSYNGYLPDRATLEQGGFEAAVGWRGYAAGTGEAVADALTDILKEAFA